MPKYNTKFDLSIKDLDLIETALRKLQSKSDQETGSPQSVSELLGRLHNQKVFYRPSQGIYVGG